MIWPEKFDQNEWYAIITSMVMITLIMALPKRFPPIVSVIIFMIGLSFSRFADHLFGSVGRFDHYDVMDSSKFEWFDLFTYPLYGYSAYIFIYLYSWLQLRKFWSKTLYILFWSIFGTIFEYTASLFDFFNYKNWSLYWSLITYLVVQPITIILFHWVMNLHKRHVMK